MRVFFLRKRCLLIAAGGILAALLFCAVSLPAAITASATARQLPIYCVDRSDNTVSISFDAAWGNEDTQQLIDILARYGVKTTFFVVGDWVDKYPESVKALHDAGHEVMNHSLHHDHYNSLSTQEIIADINACNDKIEAITGARPTLIRCPYGEYDDHVIAAIHTPEALPSVLDFFQSAGYRVVPISQLILTGDYYMDHTGKQCPAEAAS